MRHLTTENVAALRRFSEDGDVTRLPTDGTLRVVNTPLEGRLAVSVVRRGGTVWVIIDLTRDDALVHLRQLIQFWPLPATLRMPFLTGGEAVSMESVG